MKKRTSLVLALALAMVGSLAGCSGRVVYDGSAAKNIEKVEETTDVDVVEDGLKTGLALMPKVESSADAGETDGLAQTDVSIAAVTVDAEGKIVACAIDAVQVKINFDKEGKLVTALDSQFKTKQELGADYGMKAASSIQKEWNEQADAFAAYCVGKTADEITAIAAGEDGKPADVDLAAGCTMHPGNFQWLVVKAMGNAAASDANVTDAIGIGVSTKIDSSADAAEADGLAQADITVTAVTLDAEGKVTSAAIDAVQAKVNFDKTGKITTDLTAEIKTKNELGADYGMTVASSIGKEWNEQAEAFAAYCEGKTMDEIIAIAAGEDGKPADVDLAAGCTMHPGNFQWVMATAIGNAKVMNKESAEADLKTGLALMPKAESSVDAGETDGLAQADVSMAAVTVDGEGRVVACTIDAAQVKINFDAEGKVVTALDTAFKTKQELGADYGMKVASSIEKEWNEQADAFAAFCIGKTADEIAAIAAGEDGKPADVDLAAGCTMHPGNFQWLVVKAIGNAVESGAQADDTIGLGVSTKIDSSVDAGESDGLAQAYLTVTAVTVDGDGKVTSAAIDAVQVNVNFDQTGKITTDLAAEIKTKNELGADYGMKVASSIEKEWNEQAEVFASYCVGKTMDEIIAIAAGEDGKPADVDLAAGCTMHPGNFQWVMAAAIGNAK